MTIEEYSCETWMVEGKVSREADIDIGTLNDALSGKRIYKATAGKIALALSKG